MLVGSRVVSPAGTFLGIDQVARAKFEWVLLLKGVSGCNCIVERGREPKSGAGKTLMLRTCHGHCCSGGILSLIVTTTRGRHLQRQGISKLSFHIPV